MDLFDAELVALIENPPNLRRIEKQLLYVYRTARLAGITLLEISHETRVPRSALSLWLNGRRQIVRIDVLDQLLKGSDSVDRLAMKSTKRPALGLLPKAGTHTVQQRASGPRKEGKDRG